jgi:hypothetical protein
MKSTLTVGASHGTILMDVSDLKSKPAQSALRALLSLSMDRTFTLTVRVNPYSGVC